MSKTPAKLTLKKNKKLDLIYHPETMLVFKSATEKVVTGRILDDEFVSLDEEALKLCDENGFKYDETLVETEDQVEETEEETADQEEVVESQVETKTSKKEPVQEEPVKKESSTKNEKAPEILKPFFDLLERQNKELCDFMRGRQSDSDSLREKNLSLEKQVKELAEKNEVVSKKLDETQKKLKGVLAAMAADV